MSIEEARAVVMAGERPGVRYEYTSISFCADYPGDGRDDYYCDAAIRECVNNPPDQGLGPANQIFRRALDPSVGGWERRGVTCFPNLVDDGPALTMAMILNAFHDTAFAVAQVRIQPVGNVTLVTLPTFYEVAFPAAGFEPGEVDAVNLVGFNVEIRPRLDAVVYHFGDGATLGPTTDLGGPYPSGGVQHVYAERGVFEVRADVTYGGQFRVNGGAWNDIPGTASITGTPTTVTVKESRARLVTGER